jgi:membrane protease YdiL (CAAX protease family)
MDHHADSASKQPAMSSADWAMLVIALALPTAVTWPYFVALADAPSAVQQGSYAIGKAVQFGLPVVWVWRVMGWGLPWRSAGDQVPPGGRDVPGWRDALLGLAFGLAVMGAMAGLYYYGLKPAGLFEGPTAEVRAKIASFGIKTMASYAALSAFYSLGHSLLEEYYWRWFVFGHCCRGLSPPAGIGVSSVAFAAHHVLVLGTYFGYGSPLTWLFSAGIIIGGAFWAWLYRSSGSLLGPWLSHALVDAAIFVIGWDIVRGAM